MGHRIATLVRLGEPALAGGRLLIAPAEALVQLAAQHVVALDGQRRLPDGHLLIDAERVTQLPFRP